MKRLCGILISLSCVCIFLQAQNVVHIQDIETWTTDELNQYVGKTIQFDVPFYITNNYTYRSGTYNISPRRLFSPTNQEIPLSDEYNSLVKLNNKGSLQLNGLSGYHRMGEQLHNLTVRVNSTAMLQWVSADIVGNTREELEAGAPSVDLRGEHTLLACAFNLEYYLVENLGTGYGADNQYQHNRQKEKISKALNKIRADVFGFVEIEQGQSALKELAEILTDSTGKQYSYIDDGGSASGSYTKSGYVYCTETLRPIGNIRSNNTRVQNRKKMQAFEEIATGERFIFSINHFKAKSGTGTGMNADQGDGQGIFNYDRTLEAQSVITDYQANRAYYGDPDILIMGDLNAYGKEDPIRTLTGNGMTDLHRYFHQDTSYSYVFHGYAGYLDHALANSTLLGQITGMAAYHINSDEDDRFTYDGSNSDLTMFRCSDHDPVLVGLRLGAAAESMTKASITSIVTSGTQPVIRNASGGYYRITDMNGLYIAEGTIDMDNFLLPSGLSKGFYIVTIYEPNRENPTKNGKAEAYKLLIF